MLCGCPKTLREDVQTPKTTHIVCGQKGKHYFSYNELARFLLALVEVPAPFNSDEFSQDTGPFNTAKVEQT